MRQTPHQYDISYCIVCMNRTEHLKQTLEKNIKDNLGNNVEFVLLNYNSQDDLHEWCTTQMHEYLENGILKYYRTTEPTFFHRGHSRNMVFRMASGRLICTLDADNYLGKGFTEYVLEHYAQHGNMQVIKGGGAVNIATMGRMVFPHEALFMLNGYDEDMDGYGAEDDDFSFRLENAGYTTEYFLQEEFSNVITHSDVMRIKDERYLKILNSIYLQPIDFRSSKLYYLFKDGTAISMVIGDEALTKCFDPKNGIMVGGYDEIPMDKVLLDRNKNLRQTYPMPPYKELFYRSTWTAGQDKSISILGPDGNIAAYIKELSGVHTINGIPGMHIDNITNQYELIMSLTATMNRIKLDKNLQNNTIKVNQDGFGQGTITRNLENTIIKLQ